MFTAKPAGVGAFIKIVIDQIANPLALGLRLFGNVLASGIMFAVIGCGLCVYGISTAVRRTRARRDEIHAH